MKTTARSPWLTFISIVSMLGTLSVAILLNFSLDRIGYIRSATEPDSLVPLLATGVKPSLLWLNVWCGLIFTMHAINLRRGTWTPLTRVIELVADTCAIAVLGRIALSGWFFSAHGEGLLIRIGAAVLAILMLLGLEKKMSAISGNSRSSGAAQPTANNLQPKKE